MIGLLIGKESEETVEKISKLSDEGEQYCVFSLWALPEKTKKIPHLQPLRAYNFNGTMVATNIRAAEFMKTLVLPKKKYFYITSMEWLMADSLRYDDLKEIYLNDDIDLIVSNQRDYDKISQLFKEPVCIIEDWKFQELQHD
jgi:hypothetical protein